MPLNKIYKPSLLILGLLVIALSLSAWSVGDYYLGNPVYTLGARNLAMGNTGVYDTFSPMALTFNPANVVMQNSQIGLSAAALFTRNEDSRSFPLYNSFDAFIDDATYSSNINMFDDYGFAGFGKYAYGKYTVGLGLHYLPVVDFQGIYYEEVRNNRNSDNDGYPEIIAINEIDNTGAINALGFTLGGGVDLGKDRNINLGITLNALSGDSELNKSIKWSNWAMQQSIDNSTLRRNVLPDSLYTNKSDYSGMQIKIGVSHKLNNRWGFGLSYSLKSEFDRDSSIRVAYGPDTTMTIPATSVNLPTLVTTAEVKDKYILPSRLRAGFNFQPRNIMRTHFNAEIEYVTWSDVSSFFDDSWDIHLGVEHQVTNKIPLRLGFQSITEWMAMPDYANLSESGLPALEATKIITPSITAGSSVVLRKNLVLDFGLSFSWREYQALDLFRDSYYNDKLHSGLTSYLVWPNSYIYPTDRGWNNADKIRESFTQISTGLTWNW